MWMPLFIGDYLADTRRLTLEQHGAYLMLIMDYWRNGPPPDSDPTLARILAISESDWKALRPVIEPFFTIEGGKWRHGRIDQEFSRAADKQKNFEIRAQKAVAARKAQQQDAQQVEQQDAQQVGDVTFTSTSTFTTTSTKKTNGAHAPLDERIDPVVWAEFEQHRKEIRKPLTDLARSKNESILAGLTKDEQREAVNATIANRWTGLFPPRHKQSQPQRKGKLARAMEAINGSHARRNREGAGGDVGAEPRKLPFG